MMLPTKLWLLLMVLGMFFPLSALALDIAEFMIKRKRKAEEEARKAEAKRNVGGLKSAQQEEECE